jgi:purine catabolism regulator
VVPYHAKSEKTWQQEAEELVQSIKKNNKDRKIQLGAGRMIQTSLDLPDSYREARQALIIGSMVHGDSEFITGYGDLGVRRLLYLMIDHPELDRFYEENLAPLEAYDAEWESELVPTLSVYLKQGANLNSAARELFIHRHTLRYRLEQIAEILKVDIDSQEVLLNLQIAFLVKDMKGNTQV